MCGIAGLVQSHPSSPDQLQSIVASMGAAIAHRGPDAAGVWQDPQLGIAVAHQRLAILDLTPAGHQPMHSASGRYVIAFNGEIYNHQQLRRDLDAAGLAPPCRDRFGEKPLYWGLSGSGTGQALLFGSELAALRAYPGFI